VRKAVYPTSSNTSASDEPGCQDHGVQPDQELRVESADADGLRSLLSWLRLEETLRGRVRPSHESISAGHMGGVMDAVVVAVGSGGAIAVLASSLSTWLKQPRRVDIRLTLTAEDGRKVELDAQHVQDPEALLEAVSRLSRAKAIEE